MFFWFAISIFEATQAMTSRVNEGLETRIANLLEGDVRASQEALRESASNLPPLAEHVQNRYRESVRDDALRREAFQESKVSLMPCFPVMNANDGFSIVITF